MTHTEKILDRIRKLHAHAVSAKQMGSEDEAQTFAAKVSELLSQHKLQMSDLEMTEMERVEPVGEGQIHTGMGNKRVAWVETLARIVAEAHFCRTLVVTGSSTIWLVGRKSDRDVAEWMIGWLIPFIWKLSYKEMMAARKREKSSGNYYGARGFRTSFLNGFNHRLYERFRGMRSHVEMEVKRKEEATALLTGKPSTGNALVRLDKAREAVSSYIKTKYTKNASAVGQATRNTSGYEAGRKAADGVSLRGGIKGGSEPAGLIG